MAQKEIVIKVKVAGQEISMAGKQLDVFKKTIEKTKKELELLGQRTEENAEQFDKLKGDLDALNTAFGETNEELKDTTDSLEKNEEQVKSNEKQTKSFASQIRMLREELISLGERTDDNGEQFDSLTERIKEMSDQQEDLQFGTRKLDDALGSLPGPLGAVGRGFAQVDGVMKNAKSAMGSLTRQFPILNSAIVATGIGALVVIFGLLVAAVMKAFQTFKPLQDAVKNLGVAFNLVGKIIEPIIELIGKGLTKAVEGFAYAIAILTGNLDEYNRTLANEKGSKDAKEQSEERIRNLEIELNTATGLRKKEIEREIGFLKEMSEFDEKRKQEQIDAVNSRRKITEEINEIDKKFLEDSKKTAAEWALSYGVYSAVIDMGEFKKLYEEQRAELQKSLDETNKIITKNNDEYKSILRKYGKEEKDIKTEIENNFIKELEKLQNEETLLRINKQKEKELKLLEQQKNAQDDSIKKLEFSIDEINKLLDKSNTVYLLKRKEINDKYAKEEKKANEDLNKQIRDIKTSFIEDERERFYQELENKKADEIQSINETIANETVKGEAIKTIREKYAKELEQFDIEYSDKFSKRDEAKEKQDAVTLWNQYMFEKETRQMMIDAKLRAIETGYLNEIELADARSHYLKQQAEIDLESEVNAIKKLEEEKQITREQSQERQLALTDQFYSRMSEIEFNHYNEVTAAISGYRGAIEAVNGMIGILIGTMNEESKAAKALAKTQQVLTAVTLSLAAVEAFRGLMKDISKGFPINVIAVATTLATIAVAVAGWVSVFKKQKPVDTPTSSSSGGSSTPNYGKNYEYGGEIRGRRHAQGGTIIEAEDGEAIMNRGSVAMFKPMLSMMNQMGGGIPFDARLIKGDNPITKQPNQEPMIIKTYVVSNELTTEQNKQARLKDLSTI